MALHSSRDDTRSNRPHRGLDSARTFAWLEDDRRPLDWKGPANRLFTRVRHQDLERPIVEQFERVARTFLAEVNKRPEIGAAFTFFTARTK